MKQLKVKLKNSIATQLLTVIFSLYFIVTAIVTATQLSAEYYHEKEKITDEIKNLPVTFGKGLEGSLWTFSYDLLHNILIGINKLAIVSGIKVVNLDGEEIRAIGIIIDDKKNYVFVDEKGKRSDIDKKRKILAEVFEHTFTLEHIDKNEEIHNLGTWTVYSSQRIILERVKYGFILILINSVIKTIALWFIFLMVIRKMLGNPLEQIKNDLEQVDLKNIEAMKISFSSKGNDEFKLIETAFKFMLKKLNQYHHDFNQLNKNLESRVKNRTRELFREKERAQKYLDIAGTMIVALNADQTVNLINKKGCCVLGYEEQEIIGKNWFDNFIPECDREKTRNFFLQLFAGKVILSEYFENFIITKDKKKRLIAWNNVVLKDEQGKIISTLGSGEDITKRREDEQSIKNSLKEKEILLRELYHRTKNNMQVICSMLSLQALNIEDRQLLRILSDTENRIRSMALVHQKLYQSGNLSNINLKEYIIDLSNLLISSYMVKPGKTTLSISVPEDIFVLIDTAIPCGLILNELVSNSLKYAFPDEMTGEIIIMVCKNEKGNIEICVSDNGVGVPEYFDFRKTDSFGLKTVFALGEHQLQGSVKFETGKGIKCCLVFKDNFSLDRS